MSDEIQLGMFGRAPERIGHDLFKEVWSNRKAFWIGLYTGQGLSAPAIEKALGEQDTANVIAHMVNVWGYRLAGDQHTYEKVRVPMAARHRTMLAEEAMKREMELPELCRRVLVQVATDDLFKAIIEG